MYLGVHARRIEGLGEVESRVLIDGLMALTTQPAFTYAHCRRSHDLVVWDNRAVLHRAAPFATTTERRHMVRTCVAGRHGADPRRRGVTKPGRATGRTVSGRASGLAEGEVGDLTGVECRRHPVIEGEDFIRQARA